MSRSVPEVARQLWLAGPEQLELRDVAIEPPGPGEILLAIESATTCGTDLKVFLRGGHPRMLEVPGPFGHEMTGRVAARGMGVERFSEGDTLVVANSASCGSCPPCVSARENLCANLQYLNGAFADYLLLPERFVTRSSYRRPPTLPIRIASLAEPLACVEHGLERLNLASRTSALVVGAGSLGLFFVAVLAEDGHAVTAADRHPQRLAVARGLGAGDAIRVGGERSFALPRAFDVTIDATGTVDGWSSAVAATLPGGTVLFFGGCPPDSVLPLPTFPAHYDELALLGCYHHTPRSFARAVARLAASPDRYATLITDSCGLVGVEAALRAMQDRRALKVAVRP